MCQYGTNTWIVKRFLNLNADATMTRRVEIGGQILCCVYIPELGICKKV